MNDCYRCEVDKQCHYPFKVCDCVGQRKFWTLAQRKSYDADYARKMADVPRKQILPAELLKDEDESTA